MKGSDCQDRRIRPKILMSRRNKMADGMCHIGYTNVSIRYQCRFVPDCWFYLSTRARVRVNRGTTESGTKRHVSQTNMGILT